MSKIIPMQKKSQRGKTAEEVKRQYDELLQDLHHIESAGRQGSQYGGSSSSKSKGGSSSGEQRQLSSLYHLTNPHLMTVPSMHASSHGDHTRSTVLLYTCTAYQSCGECIAFGLALWVLSLAMEAFACSTVPSYIVFSLHVQFVSLPQYGPFSFLFLHMIS